MAWLHKDAVDVMRSVSLGVVLSVLATACALVEPPVPPNTDVHQGWVRNLTGHPVGLHVMTPAGALPGAVQPASVPAHTEANVTYYVPLSGGWSILADKDLMIEDDEIIKPLGEECTLGIELGADGSATYGCNMFR